MRYSFRLAILVITALIFYSCGTESTPTYTLTTSVVGEGSISPFGGEFKEGENITLTGTPNDGWLFLRWEGDWSGETNPISLTMNKNYNIVGVFQRRDYPLTITIEGEGTVEEQIISSPKSTEYPFETVVQLTPKPATGWSFLEWGGDLSGNEKPIQVIITDGTNVTVRFSPTVFLADNGITIMCPYGKVGDIGFVNGVEYEVVDRDLLIQRRDGGADLTKVCTSHVNDMSNLFNQRSFNVPIGHWDVSKVTNMHALFSFSSFNQPIGNWDVSSVISMRNMFHEAPFNHPIGTWDVSRVTDMHGMFWGSSFNQPIGNWDVSNVLNMSNMFDRSSFNQPIGDWDVSFVNTMSTMFWGSSFNQDIADWNVVNVKNMQLMFAFTVFNQPIGNWDVSNVENMAEMFRSSQFNQHIGDWDVSEVFNMNGMFVNSQFNQNISNWCVWRILTEPSNFSTNSPLTSDNKPVWGTCPD